MLPYRKDDDYLGRDVRNHGFYARSGFAGLRLDVRGTGASEGYPEDEYSEKEHEDTFTPRTRHPTSTVAVAR